jgi:hypothetical protein
VESDRDNEESLQPECRMSVNLDQIVIEHFVVVCLSLTSLTVEFVYIAAHARCMVRWCRAVHCSIVLHDVNVYLQ